MLKTRVTTATLLILIVLACIFLLPPPSFTLFSGFVFLYALWEWTKLSGIRRNYVRVACTLLVPVGVVSTLLLLEWLQRGFLFEIFPSLALTFWVLVPVVLYKFPKNENFLKIKSVGLIAGFFVLIPSWIALNYLRNTDPMPLWLLYVMVLVWVSDIAAFFAGRRFGKHKLASYISPGKTWEGVLGALVCALFVSILGYFLLKPGMSLLYWFSINLVTVVFSIVGDLFESAFKRVRNVKDSGNLLPGHGGLLDRIDSLTAALPVFAILLFY